jgi:hypothetical protein
LDTRKTTFVTPSGLDEFVSSPFGLTSVPGAFQRFMQFVLADHIEVGYCVVYCDDIAIFSQSDHPLVHLQHLEAVLASLRDYQLLAKSSHQDDDVFYLFFQKQKRAFSHIPILWVLSTTE